MRKVWKALDTAVDWFFTVTFFLFLAFMTYFGGLKTLVLTLALLGIPSLLIALWETRGPRQ